MWPTSMLSSPRDPFLNPLGGGRIESFALTRIPVVATLGLEMDVLGEKSQDLKRDTIPELSEKRQSRNNADRTAASLR
jgi:hypothetical protein